ncbi:MAG TPA: hypothetical protein VNA57_05245 [Acidimicrobiales bacterium]|nr:hypothetical protein [Acidimicrobiales bacterium]
MCDANWYQQFLELNPRERKRRDLIVDYAELQGGDVTEYFRRLFPRYWFDSDSLPVGTAGLSLGFSPEQENQMIADMSKVVLPAFRASPEYDLPHDASSFQFPQRSAS